MLRRVAVGGPATDLPCRRGRPNGALPELPHPDALGDLSRALRRLRLHQALLPRVLPATESVYSSAASPISRRRTRRHCRSCEAPAKARGLRGRCGGSCGAYRTGSPCAAGEASAPWSRLRSVNNTRHGGRGWCEIVAIEQRLRRTPDTFRGTKDPSGLLGSPVGSGQNHGARRPALSGNPESATTFGSTPARPRLPSTWNRSAQAASVKICRCASRCRREFDDRGVVLSGDIFLQFRQVHAVSLSELLRVINDEGHQRLPQV